MNLPNCKRPCSNCPFRLDTQPGWLGSERAKEIANQGSFVCHKTAHTGNDADRLQCAGHMLLLEETNDFVRMANRLGMETGLKGRETVFGSIDDFVKHHGK